MPSYVFDRETRALVPRDQFYAAKFEAVRAKRSAVAMPYVNGDLPPYPSPVTGKIIEGRAARREDLARSGCREVDPSEYKPVYKDYEFCQKRRLPYQDGDVPPPMTKDEKMWAKERRAKQRAREKAVTSLTAEKSAPFERGNTKDRVLFKNETVKD